jgi:hypothetical protein
MSQTPSKSHEDKTPLGEPERGELVKLKKSEIQVAEARMPVYLWRCKICNRLIVSPHIAKLIASAKLHLERTHGLKVEVE